MNDIPSVASQRRWAEGVVVAAEQTGASVPLVFQVSPYSTFYKTNSPNGWVDARAHNMLNVIVTPVDQNCTFSIEIMRTSNDPAPQILVAATPIVAGTTTEIYASNIDHIAFFRVLQEGTLTGTVDASFLMK